MKQSMTFGNEAYLPKHVKKKNIQSTQRYYSKQKNLASDMLNMTDIDINNISASII